MRKRRWRERRELVRNASKQCLELPNRRQERGPVVIVTRSVEINNKRKTETFKICWHVQQAGVMPFTCLSAFFYFHGYH